MQHLGSARGSDLISAPPGSWRRGEAGVPPSSPLITQSQRFHGENLYREFFFNVFSAPQASNTVSGPAVCMGLCPSAM